MHLVGAGVVASVGVERVPNGSPLVVERVAQVHSGLEAVHAVVFVEGLDQAGEPGVVGRTHQTVRSLSFVHERVGGTGVQVEVGADSVGDGGRVVEQIEHRLARALGAV